MDANCKFAQIQFKTREAVTSMLPTTLWQAIRAWETARYSHFAIDAAEVIASPQLLQTLLQMKQVICPDDNRFDEAIRLCSAQYLSEPGP